MHQPVAGDLRFIVAVLKVNNDLERMGDLAVNIAERAVQLLSVSRHMERIADLATNIAEDVVYMVEGILIRHHKIDSPE